MNDSEKRLVYTYCGHVVGHGEVKRVSAACADCRLSAYNVIENLVDEEDAVASQGDERLGERAEEQTEEVQEGTDGSLQERTEEAVEQQTEEEPERDATEETVPSEQEGEAQQADEEVAESSGHRTTAEDRQERMARWHSRDPQLRPSLSGNDSFVSDFE